MLLKALSLHLLTLLLLLYLNKGVWILCGPFVASLRAVLRCQRVWGWTSAVPEVDLVREPIRMKNFNVGL